MDGHVTVDELSYATIPNKPHTERRKTTEIIFWSCYVSIEGQRGHGVSCDLIGTQASARQGPGERSEGAGHWLLISCVEARGDTEPFQPHFTGRCTWPSLTSGRAGKSRPTCAAAQKYFTELTILIFDLMTITDLHLSFFYPVFLFPFKTCFQVLACLQMLTGMHLWK